MKEPGTQKLYQRSTGGQDACSDSAVRFGLGPSGRKAKSGEPHRNILYVQKGKARVMTQRLGLASRILESRIVLLLGTLPTSEFLIYSIFIRIETAARSQARA